MRYSRWFIFCSWLSIGLFAPNTGHAQQVSFFVQPDTTDSKTQKAKARVEGVIMDVLRSRLSKSTSSIGSIPTDMAQSIQEADEAFKVGKKAFEELNPDLAFRKFQNSAKLYRQAAPYINEVRQLCLSLLYIGVSYLLNGKRAEGQNAFEESLTYCPNINLKGITTENDKLQIFQAAQELARKKPKGKLNITANIPASIFINGRFRGVTPKVLTLPAAKHLLSIRHGGYVRTGKITNIEADKTATFNASLQKISTYNNWYTLGKKASQFISKSSKTPPEITAFSRITQTDIILLARVFVLGGDVVISAALYDAKKQTQLAAGGAKVESDAGADGIRAMVKQLLAGQDPAIGEWTPSLKPPTSIPTGPKKNNTGLIVGLTIGAAVLVGGGVTAAVIFLSPPSCKQGSCAQLQLTP